MWHHFLHTPYSHWAAVWSEAFPPPGRVSVLAWSLNRDEKLWTMGLEPPMKTAVGAFSLAGMSQQGWLWGRNSISLCAFGGLGGGGGGLMLCHSCVLWAPEGISWLQRFHSNYKTTQAITSLSFRESTNCSRKLACGEFTRSYTTGSSIPGFSDVPLQCLMQFFLRLEKVKFKHKVLTGAAIGWRSVRDVPLVYKCYEILPDMLQY